MKKRTVNDTDKTCVVDYLFPNDKNTGFDYEKVRHYGEDNFDVVS